MKQTILTMLLAVMATVCSAQVNKPKPALLGIISEFPQDESGRIYFSEIVRADSATQDHLYAGAKKFFANAFKSANNVIQMEDRPTGTIIGKGWTYVTNNPGALLTTQYRMWVSIKITCKEGRYKYELYDFNFKTDPSYPYFPDGIAFDQTALFDSLNYYSYSKPKPKNEKTKVAVFREVDNIISMMKRDMASSAVAKKDEW